MWTKAELLRDVWGYRALGHDADARLARLPAAPQARRHGERYVVNVWGVGYRLVDGDVPEAAAAATERALEEADAA